MARNDSPQNVDELRSDVEMLELKARKKKAMEILYPERSQEKDARREARRAQRRSEKQHAAQP